MNQQTNNMNNSNMIQGLNSVPQQQPANITPLEAQPVIMTPEPSKPAPTPIVHKPIQVQPIKGMTGGAINFVNGPQTGQEENK